MSSTIFRNISHPVQYKRENTQGKFTRNFTFYIDNFELKISFKLSFSSGFANLHSQKNKLLYELTLHCKVYTLHYIPYTKELSRPETSQGQGLLTSLRGDFLKKHFHTSFLANKQTTSIQ